MKNHKTLFIFVLLLFPLILSSCMPGGGSSTTDDPAGFFMGIWHGWIAPFSLVAGFFDHNIRIYEVYNHGWSYDLGFYIAILGGFGGFSFFRKKKDDR
ncbi:MAG: hypothetical protein K9J12_13715 [Melioribacteraceae bacterium]|nr:hypothetical protein [Melioribacteraceae bacterium]MCF8263179.1 hypothetical protein [Melioribacteraceae bacterium]MCF8430333.1 hypothetical protein [Melioribacteraceae bacterium]